MKEVDSEIVLRDGNFPCYNPLPSDTSEDLPLTGENNGFFPIFSPDRGRRRTSEARTEEGVITSRDGLLNRS